MALDLYSPCPCGSGKKIKFCCPDLVTELDKIQRMLDGEQFRACLEHIQRLKERYPDRPSLMNTEGVLLAQLNRRDEARAVFRRLVELHPHNSLALSQLATLTAEDEGPQAAIDILQQLMAHGSEPFPQSVLEAYITVAATLLMNGQPLAARAHLEFVLEADPENEDAARMMLEIQRTSQVPVLLKQNWAIDADQPAGCDKAKFTEALTAAARGTWATAAEKFAALAEATPAAPVLWRNAGLLQVYLGRDEQAIAPLRKYAAGNVPVDDAMETEALAQLLDGVAPEDQIALVRVEYPITDMERLMATLASDRRLSRVPFDPQQFGDEDQPPPRSVYQILDRPLPPTAEATLDELPRMVGQVHVYGNQTDRAARAELIGYADGTLETARQVLTEIAGDSLGAAAEPVVLNPFATARGSFVSRLRFPNEMPPEQVLQLSEGYLRDWILNIWPQTQFAQLGGQTPTQAASEASRRIPLEAMILLLEQSLADGGRESVIHELRAQLGLPQPAPIDPMRMDQVPPEEMPVSRFTRLEVDKLTDEQLLLLFPRAAAVRASQAVELLGEEILRRKSLDGKREKSQVLAQMTSAQRDPRRALELVERGRAAAEAEGKSSATWDVHELTLRYTLGQVAELERLMTHITSEHLKEPGIREALAGFLMRIGALGPDGQPTRQPLPGGEADAEAGLMLPEGAAPEESGKLWTPGGETPTSSGGGSKLWTPGMD